MDEPAKTPRRPMAPEDGRRHSVFVREVGVDTREVVWLVCDWRSLGMFAARDDAEVPTAQARAERGVQTDDVPRDWSVRVEPWFVAPASTAPPLERTLRRDLLEVVHRDWGLLNIPETGAGHLPPRRLPGGALLGQASWHPGRVHQSTTAPCAAWRQSFGVLADQKGRHRSRGGLTGAADRRAPRGVLGTGSSGPPCRLALPQAPGADRGRHYGAPSSSSSTFGRCRGRGQRSDVALFEHGSSGILETGAEP